VKIGQAGAAVGSQFDVIVSDHIEADPSMPSARAYHLGQKARCNLLIRHDALTAQRRILASPDLSLQQIAKREGRCRTQLARLLRLSRLSRRIIEAIAEGTQPIGLTRRGLLVGELPSHRASLASL
jgi:hypothetical protein